VTLGSVLVVRTSTRAVQHALRTAPAVLQALVRVKGTRRRPRLQRSAFNASALLLVQNTTRSLGASRKDCGGKLAPLQGDGRRAKV